jgi:hypothetical protein
MAALAQEADATIEALEVKVAKLEAEGKERVTAANIEAAKAIESRDKLRAYVKTIRDGARDHVSLLQGLLAAEPE